jgi:hypothetical protein
MVFIYTRLQNILYDYDNEPGNDEMSIYIHQQTIPPIYTAYRIICSIFNCCICHTD